MQAASLIGSTLPAFMAWIDRDPELALDVDRAESMAHGEGAAPSAMPAKPTTDPKGDRWATIRQEAAKLAPGMFGLLLYVDGILAARPGAHALSPYDRWSLGEWYASGKPVYLARKGRGAGKSTMQIKIAISECIFGERSVPPGETWIWPFLSVDMDESNLKVGPLESSLKGLGFGSSDLVVHRRQQGRTTISFEDDRGQQIEVRVYPNTVSAMSGPTGAGATNDEEAKWKANKDRGQNSAEEVLTAQAGIFRGDLRRKHLRISSAWLTKGPHYDDIEAGDTEARFVARLGPFLGEAIAGFELVASKLATMGRSEDASTIRAYTRTLTAESPNIPTWVANPTHNIWGAFLLLGCKIKEWMRENGSVSTAEGDDDGEFFDAELLGAALATAPPGGDGPCFASLDPGSRSNACALAIVRRVEHARGWRWVPVLLREWRPTPGHPLDLRMRTLPEAARLCRARGVDLWVTDVHALTDVEIVGAEHGIATRCRAEGNAFEDEYRPVRDAVHRGETPLAGCEGAAELARQLGLVRSIPGDKGHVRIVVQDDGLLHGDLQRAWVSACAEAGAGTLREDDPSTGIATLPSKYGSVDPRGGGRRQMDRR